MCRPRYGSREEGGGRTHRSAPTRWGRRLGTNGNWREMAPFPAGRDGARPLQKNGSGPAHGGVRLGCGFRQPNSEAEFGASVMGIGPYALRGTRDGGRHAGSSCPTGGCGEPPRLPWVAAHSGASAARMGGIGSRARQRSSPRCPSTSDNPSVMAFGHASSLCTREPLGRGMRIAASRRSSQ